MRRRYQVQILVLAFLLALVPRLALADTFIGTTERGANEGEDKNIAACLACGENYLTMDSGLRAALFGSTVDGGEGTAESPNFPKFAYFRDTCYMNEFTSTMKGRAWSRLNDFTYAWALSDARADLQRALRMWQSDGTESGGGSGGETPDGELGTIEIPTIYYGNANSNGRTVRVYDDALSSSTKYHAGSTGNTSNAQLGTPITLNLPQAIRTAAYEKIQEGYTLYVAVGHWGYVGSVWEKGTDGQYRLYFVPNDANVTYVYDGVNRPQFILPSGTTYYYHGYSDYNIVLKTGLELNMPNTNYNQISEKTSNGSNLLASGDIFGFGNVNGTGGGTGGGEFGDDDDDNVFNPTNPPDDTPTKPTNPTQPTVTPTEPNYNVYIDNSTTTTTADLTPILEAIRILNDNLIAGFENVEEAISTCCENMRAFLDAWFAHFSDMIENFSDNVDDWFKWFSEKQYIWLKQIDDDINATSSQIQSWLQMIYNRMNGGGSTVPNPDTQTDDYFDWWDYFIQKLLGLLPDGVSDFLDVLGGLKEVFPFSVPWDVGLILGVFAADPVIPVFDVQLPTYASSGGWQLVPIHVDLTPWDGVAQLIRSGVLLVFAFYLALWTRDGLRHFEV